MPRTDKRGRPRKTDRTCRPWSEREDRIILTQRRDARHLKELAPLLPGRTLRAIQMRGFRLGVKRSSVETLWLKTIAEHETDAAIAKVMDAELSTVAWMRYKLRKQGHSTPKRKTGPKPTTPKGTST